LKGFKVVEVDELPSCFWWMYKTQRISSETKGTLPKNARINK